MGKKSYAGLALQAAAGTPETAADVFLPLEDFPDIKTQAPNYYSKEFRGVFAEISHVYRKPALSSSGSIKMPAYADPLTYLLLGVCGSVSTAGDVEGYTNTYTMAETLPIWTVFLGTDSLNVEKYHDMMMKSMELSFEQGEPIQVSVDMEGASGDIATSALTPTYTARRALNAADVEITLGGSANCTIDSLTLTIDRGVQTNKVFCATGLSAWEPNMMYPTTTIIEGEFTAYFAGYDDYEMFLGKTNATELTTGDYAVDDADQALVITATGTEEINAGGAATVDLLTLTLHKILYDDYSVERTFDDRVKATVAFKAMWDTAATPDEVAAISLISGVDGDSIA